MLKTKSANLVLIFMLLVFTPISYAAEYEWTGATGQDWDNPSNWDVTGSMYTWPNEEFSPWDRVNTDCDEINIGTGGIVDRWGSLNIRGADDGSNEAVLTLDHSSQLSVRYKSTPPPWGADIGIARGGDSRGVVEVRDGSYLDLVYGAIRIGEGNNSVGKFTINGASAHIAQWLIVGRTSKGVLEMKDGTLDIGGFGGPSAWSTLYLAYLQGSTGTIEAKSSSITMDGSLIVACADDSTGAAEIKDTVIDMGVNLDIANAPTSVGTVEIRNSTLSVGSVSVGRKGTGKLEMREGLVEVASDLTVGREPTATGTLELRGGTINVGGRLQIGYAQAVGKVEVRHGTVNSRSVFMGTHGGDAELRINEGKVIADRRIVLGPDGVGHIRIFLNGGLLQGQALYFGCPDSLIVFRGGELWINRFALSEADMQDLIDIGKIDAPADCQITTVGDYTVLGSSGE